MFLTIILLPYPYILNLFKLDQTSNSSKK